MSKKRKSRGGVPGDSVGGDCVGDRIVQRPSSLVRWSLPLFLVFLALYLVLFFTSPESALRPPPGSDDPLLRIDMARWLWQVRLPELPQVWSGGAWTNIGVVDRLYVLLAASIVLLLSWACGWSLLHLLRLNSGLDGVESAVFSLGLGLNAVSLLLMIVGVFGLLRWLPWMLVALVVVLLTDRLPHLIRQWRRGSFVSDVERTAESGKRDAYPMSALWLGAPFLLLITLGALFPPREFDVREYHLQAPKEWFQGGRITFLPHNVYGNMPMGPQILSLPAMALTPGERSWWWGAMAGKVLLASYAPLTALALFAAGRRFFGVSAGVVAALVYISIPWVAHVAMEGYVDAVLACYLFLAVYAALLAGAADDASQRWRRWLLAGFLAGAAVSSKYPAALFVIGPLTVWVVANRLIAPRQPAPLSNAPPIPLWRRFDLKSIAAFLVAVGIGGGPWLAKNWALTGNPTYPLLYRVFDGQSRTPDLDARWRAAHAVPRNAYGERYSPRQIGDAAANVLVRSEWLSPLLWPLAALALFSSKNRRTMFALVAMLAFVLVAWFALTHRIDRFWLPALPLAALLAGVGAAWRTGAWWRRVVFAILFWGLVWNLMILAGALAPPKLLVDYQTLRNDASLAPLAHTYLNENVTAGHSVVLVGDAQPFDLDMPAHYNTCFDACVLEQWLKFKSPAEQRAALHSRNVSHVLVNWSELARYRSPGNYGYSAWPQPEVFHALVRTGVLKNPQRVRSRASGQWGELYEVADPP